MVISQTKLESEVAGLSAEAFDTFCNDLTGMFGVDMECTQQEVSTETVKGLKKRFKKLVAVNSVKAEGALCGTFQLIFDQEGLFTLGGVIVMLPEKRILENRKRGSDEDTKDMSDAVGEAGNLLVGAWDRIFRENLEGHGHFAQTNTYIGKPWDKPQETIGLADDEEFVFVSYEMTIAPYSGFSCGVIFPKTIFVGPSEPDTDQPAPAEQSDTKEETNEEASAEEKAGAGEETAAEQEAPTDEEASAEQSVTDADTKVPDSTAETETAAAQEGKESAGGEISETIQRMTQSPAELPGEPAPPTIAEEPALSSAGVSPATCAKDIMQTPVVWGSGDDSMQQALTKMQQVDGGYMMVGQDGIAEGIVSKSDITGAISPYLRPIFAKWQRPLDDATLQIKVKWIMSRPVRTVKPETSLASIMENMRQAGLRGLPVMDQQGKIQGLVTVFDIFKVLLGEVSEVASVGKTPQAPPLV